MNDSSNDFLEAVVATSEIAGQNIPRDSLSAESILKNLRERQITRDKLVGCNSPEVIFGALEGKDIEKLAALNVRYFELAKQCRPNPADGHDSIECKLAVESTAALSKLYREAQERIHQNTYGARISIENSADIEPTLAIIESEKCSYALHELLADGDVALVYRASFKDNDGVAHQACIKVVKDASDNELLDNERSILSKLDHVSLPKLIDSFEMGDGRTVNAFEPAAGYGLHKIRQMATHARGLENPNYHLGWILERTLAALGYLHSKGIVHGSVEPAHLIVDPANHNVMLIDFCWAVENPKKDDRIKIGQEWYSAPEIFSKALPHPAMDIYGLGKSAIYLLGGDLESETSPDTIDPMYQKILGRMIEENVQRRASDAYQLAHHVLVVREEISKDREFIPLPVDS